MTTEKLQFAPKEVMARKDMDIRTGDTVRVHIRIREKEKTRIQIFEGLVLACKHGKEAGGTFTVRKVASGVGVERIFPIYSPNIDKIEIVKRSRVRKSKLYYIRAKVARDIRRKMRNFIQFTATTDDLVIPPEEMMEEQPEETKEDAPKTEETPVEVKEETKIEEETPKEEAKTEEVPAEKEETKKEEEKTDE